MPTATGQLRYDPTVPGLPLNGHWMVLSCDMDWHRMYVPDVERMAPGTWMLVADADRIFDNTYQGRPQQPVLRRFRKGGDYIEHQVADPSSLPNVFVDYTPHLGLVRPRFDPPAWGPHISIIRGEQPTRNQDIWDILARRRGSAEMPDWLRQNASVEFEYDPELHMARTHWYLRIRCPQVMAIRRFYGLSDYPKVPLHLTVGVSAS